MSPSEHLTADLVDQWAQQITRHSDPVRQEGVIKLNEDFVGIPDMGAGISDSVVYFILLKRRIAMSADYIIFAIVAVLSVGGGLLLLRKIKIDQRRRRRNLRRR